MSNHTPGPWKIKENASMVCVYAKSFNVACTGSSGVEKDNARNNAKLIAAAPDLLEALALAESSFSTYEKTGAFAAGQPSSWMLKTIREAIAKATN